MNSKKYIGLDVHQATISVAVLDSTGKLVMESILETKAATILQFFAGLRGSLYVTFEEGTWATWLYDLLKPHVAKLVVCNPRKNALLKAGNKSDRIDARKLAELLRGNHLRPVYIFLPPPGFHRQAGDGIHPGDERGDDSAVLCWIARPSAGDLRRKHLRRLALRSAEAADADQQLPLIWFRLGQLIVYDDAGLTELKYSCRFHLSLRKYV